MTPSIFQKRFHLSPAIFQVPLNLRQGADWGGLFELESRSGWMRNPIASLNNLREKLRWLQRTGEQCLEEIWLHLSNDCERLQTRVEFLLQTALCQRLQSYPREYPHTRRGSTDWENFAGITHVPFFGRFEYLCVPGSFQIPRMLYYTEILY